MIRASSKSVNVWAKCESTALAKNAAPLYTGSPILTLGNGPPTNRLERVVVTHLAANETLDRMP